MKKEACPKIGDGVSPYPDEEDSEAADPAIWHTQHYGEDGALISPNV